MEEKNNKSQVYNLEDFESFAEQLLKNKTAQTRSKLWRNLISQKLNWIKQKLNEGFTKKEIFEVMSKYIKEKYGKKYLITPNYFYMLLKEFLNEKSQSKEKRATVEPQMSSGEAENRPNKKTVLDEHNEGGIL